MMPLVKSGCGSRSQSRQKPVICPLPVDLTFFGGGGGTVPLGLWGFSSPTRDQIQALGRESTESYHWPTRESPGPHFFEAIK